MNERLMDPQMILAFEIDKTSLNTKDNLDLLI